MCSSSSVLSVSLCLLMCLPLCLSSKDHQDVIVKPGEDTTLHCRSSGEVEVIQIIWIRPDLTLEEFVFHYKDGQFQEDSQHLSYQDRVELKDPEMKNGEFSVVLKNVNLDDTGKYECRIRNTGSELKMISSIYLTVQDSENKTTEPGQSVSLPCRAPSNTEITAVEWTRPEMKPEYIFVYRDGKPDPDNQHPSYQNRVELKDREMKDGDVSMILTNVNRDDEGTYECRVFHTETESRSRSTEPISVITLQVQSGETEERGDKERGDKEGGDKDGGDKEGGDEEEGDKGLHIGLGVGLTAAALLAGVVALIVYRKHQAEYEAAEPADPAENGL